MSYSKLHGRIVELFGTQAAFAKAMGISRSGLSMRMNNKISWTLEELTLAVELLKIPKKDIPVYFFTPKVR